VSKQVCDLCGKRGKTWEGDDPRCAFAGRDWFVPDNWMCATMIRLRDIAQRNGWEHRDDNIGSIAYVPFEGDNNAGFIVMSYYKNRGATGMATVMDDDHPPRPLTLREAKEAIAYHERRAKA
jgi:hypothetical protein